MLKSSLSVFTVAACILLPGAGAADTAKNKNLDAPGTREPQLRKGLKFTQSIDSLKISCEH